jgi:hypothetical protein
VRARASGPRERTGLTSGKPSASRGFEGHPARTRAGHPSGRSAHPRGAGRARTGGPGPQDRGRSIAATIRSPGPPRSGPRGRLAMVAIRPSAGVVPETVGRAGGRRTARDRTARDPDRIDSDGLEAGVRPVENRTDPGFL